MYPSNHGNYDEDEDDDDVIHLPSSSTNTTTNNNNRAGSSRSATNPNSRPSSAAGGSSSSAARRFANPPMNNPYGGGGPFGMGGGFGGMGGMGGQPGGLLSHLMGGGYGGGYGGMMGGGGRRAMDGSFDDYFKAYSTAMMEGNERPNLAYGGKIIMPPSALARLSDLEIDSPWTFQLQNPKDPAKYVTHAGVLEFIAQEGCCYLPAWMMKQLKLGEGDPLRLKNTTLPKGKFVKIQAQSTEFLQVTDAKVVLETALRNYTALSKGDIVEITYNGLTFEFLILETKPEVAGIMVIDTDLEVDFAAPVGYVEPERPKALPIPTMADKLKIDLNSTTAATRPPSAASGRPGSSLAGSLDTGSEFETFKGIGNTMSGKKVKGKGLARKIEDVDRDSKIVRTDKPRMMTNELLTDGKLVPAALNLPKGKLFFGFTYKAFDPSLKTTKVEPGDGTGAEVKPSFVGSGTTLSGRQPTGQPQASSSSSSVPTGVLPTIKTEQADDPWAKLAGGNSLAASGSNRRIGGGIAAPIVVADDDDEEDDNEDDDGDRDDDMGDDIGGEDDDDDNDEGYADFDEDGNYIYGAEDDAIVIDDD